MRTGKWPIHQRQVPGAPGSALDMGKHEPELGEASRRQLARRCCRASAWTVSPRTAGALIRIEAIDADSDHRRWNYRLGGGL